MGQQEDLNQEILNAQARIDQQNTLLGQKSVQLEEKQKQVYGQSQEIEDKLKLLETRNKMLQLSIERNIYKKKVIYSLLAIILALIIGMLMFYSFFNKVRAQL